MDKNISDKIDCLFNEIVSLKTKEAAGTHFVPKTVELFKTRLTEIFMRECETALRPMLRDMISRGTAVKTIREHFGMDEENATIVE